MPDPKNPRNKPDWHVHASSIHQAGFSFEFSHSYCLGADRRMPLPESQQKRDSKRRASTTANAGHNVSEISVNPS